MVRVGIIGFGLAGRMLHAPVIEAVPGLRVTAVASSRADDVRRLLPDVTVHAEPEALLADPAVDCVVIASPNRTHAPLARRALAAGKHVVVDKPFVLDADDGEALIDLARRSERLLTVYHNRRWDGDFLTVQRLVGERRLGDIRLTELRWNRFRPAIKEGWREVTGPGSGLLTDLGPHLVDQALVLFGRPDALSADIAIQREAATVDDYFEITLHYGPARAILSASTLAAAPRPRFALHGTGGSFVKHGIDPQEAVLRAGGGPDQPRFGEEAPEAYGTFTDASGGQERIPTERGDWRRFYQGVAAAILDGAAPPVDPADAVTGLRLLALARDSAATGQRLIPG